MHNSATEEPRYISDAYELEGFELPVSGAIAICFLPPQLLEREPYIIYRSLRTVFCHIRDKLDSFESASCVDPKSCGCIVYKGTQTSTPLHGVWGKSVLDPRT